MSRHSILVFAWIAFFSLFSSVCVKADEIKKDKKHSASIRFLLLDVMRPNRYVPMGKTGLMTIVPVPPSELPPIELFMKGPGGDYKKIHAASRVISRPLIIEKPVSKYSLYEKVEVDAKAPGTLAKDSKTAWKPVLSFPIVSTEQLVCYYQTALTGDWNPPKMAVIDVGNEKFPPNSVMILNALRTPAVIQFGAGAKALPLEPGAYVNLPVVNDNSGAVPMKIARNTGGGKYVVIANTSRVFQNDMRYVIVLKEEDPEISGRDAEVSIMKFIKKKSEDGK